LDTNGSGVFEAATDHFMNGFFMPAPVNGTIYSPLATDLAVSGDWVGDGKSRIGIYRPTTGQWFLDTNANGVFDAGDTLTNFGGVRATFRSLVTGLASARVVSVSSATASSGCLT